MREVTLQDFEGAMWVNVTDVVRPNCEAQYRSARVLSFFVYGQPSEPLQVGVRKEYPGGRFSSFSVTGEDCYATEQLQPTSGWAEIVRHERDPRTKVLESQIRFSFQFGDETLEGTVTGRSCFTGKSQGCF